MKKNQQDQMESNIQPDNFVLPAAPMSHPLPPTSEQLDPPTESTLDMLLGDDIQPGAGVLAGLLDSFREQNNTAETQSIFENSHETANESKGSKVHKKAALAQSKLNFHPSDTDLTPSVPMKKKQINAADSDI